MYFTPLNTPQLLQLYEPYFSPNDSSDQLLKALIQVFDLFIESENKLLKNFHDLVHIQPTLKQILHSTVEYKSMITDLQNQDKSLQTSVSDQLGKGFYALNLLLYNQSVSMEKRTLVVQKTMDLFLETIPLQIKPSWAVYFNELHKEILEADFQNLQPKTVSSNSSKI